MLTISIAPHSSQWAHIVRWPLIPDAHAMRSFGIWEQLLEPRKWRSATFMADGRCKCKKITPARPPTVNKLYTYP